VSPPNEILLILFLRLVYIFEKKFVIFEEKETNMKTYAEQVYTQLQSLPETLQLEVLDFISFLHWKTEKKQDKTTLQEELSEDDRLGLAMEQAKSEPVYSREEALKMLEEND